MRTRPPSPRSRITSSSTACSSPAIRLSGRSARLPPMPPTSPSSTPTSATSRPSGQDSQAIAAWNSPGPFVIRNNYLEAAGENIMFGGAHISVPGVIPSDITVEGNLLTKDPGWRGTSWTVKNVFELKNARRVIVRRNILQFTWGGAQAGFAVVLTPRNSSGQTPWVVVSDVEFSGNVVAHSGSAFNLLGHDDTDAERPARSCRHQRQPGVRHRRRLRGTAPGPSPRLAASRADITFDHNTVMHSGNIVTFYSGNYPDASGTSVNGGPIDRIRVQEQPAAPQRLRHLRQRPGVRQRVARLLRTWRGRAAKRHGQQRVDRVALSRRQPVSVASPPSTRRSGTRQRRTTGSCPGVRTSAPEPTAETSGATSRRSMRPRRRQPDRPAHSQVTHRLSAVSAPLSRYQQMPWYSAETLAGSNGTRTRSRTT